MTIASFLAYAIALAIAAAIPGPGVTAIVARALGTGLARTLPMLTGLVLGDLTYLFLAVAGLAVIAKAFAGVFLVVKILGAAYLAWLAWKFWSAGISIPKVDAAPGRREGLASFLGGLALTLGNPKTIVFYLALVPTVIDLHQVDIPSFLALAGITVVVLYLVLLPYVVLASRARAALQRPAMLRLVNRFAALAMAGTASWVIART